MSTRNDTVLTNFFLSHDEREVLRSIAEQDGIYGMSSVVRRLIREEGRRRGLLPAVAVETQPQPAALKS